MNSDEKKSDLAEKIVVLAEENGLAIVPIDENSAEIFAANNNSMCRILRNSEEFAPRCAEFCGKAYKTASEAGKNVAVKCHAGLSFLAVPFHEENKKFAAIVGRCFTKVEDYRIATERAAEGDFAQFSTDELFKNLLFANSIGEAEKIAATLKSEKNLLAEFFSETEKKERETAEENIAEQKIPKPDTELFPNENAKQKNDIEKETKAIKINADVWRSAFGQMLNSDYREACALILNYIADRYNFADSVWLEIRNESLHTVVAHGRFADEAIQINLAANDERLLEALRTENALELRESREDEAGEDKSIWLFPFAVGGEIRGALLVVNGRATAQTKKNMARFCNKISQQTEILRLRQDLERQTILSQSVKRINEDLNNLEAENFWEYLSSFFVELMQSERSSLLFFDEAANKFTVKSAKGRRAEIIKQETENLGKKIAAGVFESGEPLVVRELAEAEIPPAPKEFKYRTESFISYPLTLDSRKIGVLNVTDRINGKHYSNFDLELIESLTPQISAAYERLSLKRKAGEFEQLSVTDSLTGLSNRRYLEARLDEEIKRSQRNGSPMSFLMIDVDEFKSYNDAFGHLEGDKALQIVARCLRETLRGADVAARFGGEEFSILLPQTTLSEAFSTAERVRQKVAQAEFPNRSITVSIGVAACPPKCSKTDLLAAADNALYISKKSGRNQVSVFED